jgi:hypothetical protein
MQNNKDEFLGAGYEAPKGGSSYMKLIKGENVIRILSNAITGFEFWNDDNKPVRSKEVPSSTPNIKCDADGVPTRVKHFWAFVVYNYATSGIEILQINQSSIQTAITNLVKDEDWGNPKGYDIKITKKGDGLTTEYSVNPKPAKPVDTEILAKFNANSINLEALFVGGNPFEKSVADVKPIEGF